MCVYYGSYMSENANALIPDTSTREATKITVTKSVADFLILILNPPFKYDEKLFSPKIIVAYIFFKVYNSCKKQQNI